MCLVSKAWLKAYRDSPQHFELCNADPDDVQRLSKFLPGLASLTVAHSNRGCQVDALSTLSFLTRLDFRAFPYRGTEYRSAQQKRDAPLVELRHVPPSVKHLTLSGVYANPNTFDGIRCSSSSIIRVSFSRRGLKTPDEAAKLLRHLPKLKVRDLQIVG